VFKKNAGGFGKTKKLPKEHIPIIAAPRIKPSASILGKRSRLNNPSEVDAVSS
jgi:hypothetical protein